MKIFKIKYPKEVFSRRERSPDRKRFTTKYLIKILKEEYAMEVIEKDFCKNENGKPYLKNSNLFFNLSHSNQYMIIAFGKKDLGVDIEELRELDFLSLSKRFFRKEENQFIFNSEDQKTAFFRIWTLKESYIKWKGGSLPRDLQAFRIEIKKGSIKVYEEDDEIKQLNIKEYQMDNYLISVCSEENKFPDSLINFK